MKFNQDDLCICKHSKYEHKYAISEFGSTYRNPAGNICATCYWTGSVKTKDVCLKFQLDNLFYVEKCAKLKGLI
jgi:hypothetical protein